MINLLKRLKRDEAGQFALWIGLLGIPLSIGIGAAIDVENGNRYKNNLEAALDSAALAAVQPALLTNAEREKLARKVFDDNFPNSENMLLTLGVNATREEVDMVASLDVPSFIGGAVGRDAITVGEKSKAILTKADTVCVLALDESSPEALVFKDHSIFNAPTCSVQVNSSHPEAMVSDVLTPPVATNFCSSGGAVGSYYPRVKTNCSPIEDPYKDLEIPPAGTSCDQRRQVTITGSNNNGNGRGNVTTYSYLESQLERTADGSSIIPDYSTLQPGIYCRGLTIEGANVNLAPGVYHVWGDIHFTNNAQVYGNGVTFILKGEDNRLLVDQDANVWLKAPSSGLTEGLVFWQKYLNFFGYIRGRVPADPERVIATSEINSGGGLHIVGTAYLPNHKLVISSENSVSSQSPATSFIAYQIEFGGKANMQVAVDHVRAGLPPIKPFTDDGARLIE